MEVSEIPVDKIIGSLCRMRLEFDYEKDPVVRKMWLKSVHIHRSQKGDKITVEVSGPTDIVDKLEALIEPIKKARKRFRDILGRDEEIP